MKKSHILLIGVFLGMTFLLSACMVGPRVTGTPGISVDEELVYISYGTSVYAINLETETVAWAYPEETNNQVVFFAQPLVAGDYVYVGDVAKTFHKIDRESGEEVWTFSGAEGFFMGKAAESDGVVYAPCNDGTLYALDSDGTLLWKFETGRYLWSQPQVVDGVIFLGSMDHSVYAIDLDGEEIWSLDLGGAINAAPLINADGSILYAGSLGKQMFALDTTDGEILWTFDTEASLWGDPLLVEDTLYFADSAGYIYAVEAGTGEVVWQKESSGSVVGGLTLIDDGFVLTTSEGDVKAFNFDGISEWIDPIGGEIAQAAVANSEYIVVGTMGGDDLVYVYSHDGTKLWFKTPER